MHLIRKGEGNLEEEMIDAVERMKVGDKQAFDMIYEQYKNMAMRTIYLIVGNKVDSEDIVQESFIKCYQHIKELKHNEQFKSWFFHILTRTAWAYCKKKSREVPKEDIYDYFSSSVERSAADMMMEKENTTTIMAFIEQLPVKQRVVIVLYYFNEFSTKEIASILGCFEGTVKSRLFTARKSLKEVMLKAQKVKEDGCDEQILYRQRDCRSI